jgi:methyltransferase (TIGR00027 family)
VKDDSPSRTAAWVAAARQLAQLLPPEAQLVADPYGAAFSYPRLRARIDRLRPLAETRVMKQWILYMQVRTRVIDDALRTWVAGGGRQVVLLGAGYDTRAVRLPELAAVDVFEVDHPATQHHKQGVLAQLGVESPSRYVTWDFETRAMDDLPDVLEEAGLDRQKPVFTIWEGVTMYLTDAAIDASLRAIRAWSPPGSRLAMTYFAKSRIEQPTLATRAQGDRRDVRRALAIRVGSRSAAGVSRGARVPPRARHRDAGGRTRAVAAGVCRARGARRSPFLARRARGYRPRELSYVSVRLRTCA